MPLSSEDAVVAAPGKDVLILMIYAYLTFNANRRLVFKDENDKCADTETIFSHLAKCIP